MKVLMKNLIIATLFASLSVVSFAHPGGADENGCHFKKGIGRHCHAQNEGKYIPLTEEKRLKKLHRETCNSIDGEGRKVRVDLYGKPCRNR